MARVTWSIHETHSPKLVGLVSTQCHNLYFQARLLKQGYVSAFTTGRGNGSRTFVDPLPFVQGCPGKAEEQSITTTPPCILPAQSSSSTICLVTWDAGSQC